MDYKHLIAGALAFSLAACAAGCKDKKSSSSSESASAADSSTTADVHTDTTNTTGEEPTPPVPAEATDPNTVTFDDGDFSFAAVISSDKECAAGELSVVEVHGNKMLKFTDDMKTPQKGKVQKIEIHPAPLIGQENLGKVRRIEFDVYADATAANYTNKDGEQVQVPGTISCGGGSVTASLDSEGNGKWYDFAEFAGGEYNFDFSGAVHGTFKFLLADSGQCWNSEMEDANFLIMRWGIENDSNLYIDNIVFYDEDGKSMPIIKPSDKPAVETTTVTANTAPNEEPVTEPSIVSTEELPDGSKKMTYSNGEVHVIAPDGSEDLDQYVPAPETEPAQTAANNGDLYDEEGNNIL